MIDAATWIAQTLDLHAPDIGAIPEALRPKDLDAGYALQDRVTALMSSRGHGATIGWKVGSTTASMQRLLGVPQPAAGRMFESSLMHAGATIDFGRYRRPAIECEVAVRLGQPLDARARAHRGRERGLGGLEGGGGGRGCGGREVRRCG